MDGILIIDKPAGITSHDVVAKCRRILRMKRIGHTGTLDPFATGVMIVLVGRATRLARFLDKDEKEYSATIDFNFATDTGDLTGKPVQVQSAKCKVQSLESETLKSAVVRVLPEFRGEISQTPPMYSAKKVDGKKLYELARKGIEIEREPVRINISALEIIRDERGENENNQLNIRVACSAGTYIRVLAEDIGKAINKGAHLAALRRLRAGRFSIHSAVTLENLTEIAANERLAEILVSPRDALAHLPEIVLTEDETRRVKNGMSLRRADFQFGEGNFVRLTEAENLLAVGFCDAAKNAIQPKIVLDAA